MKFKLQDKKELALSLVVLLITVGLFLHVIQNYSSSDAPAVHKGRIVDITEENLQGYTDIKAGYQELEIEVLDGKYEGQVIPGVNILIYDLQFDTYLEVGDPVSIAIDDTAESSPTAKVVNFHRKNIMYIMAGIFILLMLLLGRMKGFRSLISLMFIIGLIAAVLLPLITQGYSPVAVTVLVCIIGGFTTMFMVAGLNKKGVVASIGLLIGAICSGVMALVGGNLMKLSGATSGFEQLLALYLPIKLDIPGIFFSGVIIACLGAIMDVAIEISSSLYELKRRSPDISFGQLVESGMNIGRDVMGTMSNTLVLVYVGSSLAMLLYFSSLGFIYDYAIDLNLVASMFLEAISGSIGLILTIPATVILGAYFYTRWWPSTENANIDT